MWRMCAILAATGVFVFSAAAAHAQEGTDPYIFVQDTRDEQGPSVNAAWWVRDMEIRPNGKVVVGVPIEALNTALGEYEAPWCFANAQSARSFAAVSPEVQAEIDQTMTERAPQTFAASGAFTGRDRQDAVVGSYQTCNGEIGSFILVTDRATAPNVVYLHHWPEWKGVIWVRAEDDGLAVGSCFECGHVEGLFFDRRRQRFYWETLGD